MRNFVRGAEDRVCLFVVAEILLRPGNHRFNQFIDSAELNNFLVRKYKAMLDVHE